MRIELDAVCRAAIAEGATEGAVEETVRLICARLYGGQAQTATRAVMRVIELEAERAGGSRLAALRSLSEGQGSLEISTRGYGSPGEMSPEMRERFREMIASGKPQVERRVVHRWDAADGPPPPEVLAAAREALGEDVAIAGTPSLRRRRLKRALLVLAVTLVVALAPAVLVLIQTIHDHGAGARQRALEELEQGVARSPEDLALGLRLAQAYAGKLAMVGSLDGLRRWTEAQGLEPLETERFRERIAKMEQWTGYSASPAEVVETARKGEQIARRLIEQGGTTPLERATLRLLLGHFLLAQDRIDEALEAADRAAEPLPDDPRPHLLRAAVCERTGHYARGIEENEAALAKLDPWVERHPQSVLYLIPGLAPGAEESARRPDPARLARDLRARIEVHNVLLQTLESAGAR